MATKTIDIENLTLDDVKAIITNANEEDAWLSSLPRSLTTAAKNSLRDTTKAYYHGWHFQNGAGWIGATQMLDSTNTPVSALTAIDEKFTPHNAIAKIINNITNALLGNEPTWSLTVKRALKTGEKPNAKEQALIDEAGAALAAFWDKRRLHKFILSATRELLYGTRQPVRFHVPTKFIQRTEGNETASRIPAAGNVQTALDKLHLLSLDVAEAAVYTDPDSFEQIGVLLFKPENETEYAQSYRVEADGTVGVTEIRESGAVGQPVRLNLSGQLPVYELQNDRLVTDSIIRNQKAINGDGTTITKNSIGAGFRERIIFNAQQPMRKVWNETTQKDDDVPDVFYSGEGAINFLSGYEFDTNTGKGITSPSAQIIDPVPAGSLIETARFHLNNLLAEANQDFFQDTSGVSLSAESRIQARYKFLLSIKTTKAVVEDFGRWILHGVLAHAAHFMNQAGRYNELRADFTCSVDVGPLSPQELQVIGDQYKSGLITFDRVCMLLGEKDPEAARQALIADADFRRQLAEAALPKPATA